MTTSLIRLSSSYESRKPEARNPRSTSLRERRQWGEHVGKHETSFSQPSPPTPQLLQDRRLLSRDLADFAFRAWPAGPLQQLQRLGEGHVQAAEVRGSGDGHGLLLCWLTGSGNVVGTALMRGKGRYPVEQSLSAGTRIRRTERATGPVGPSGERLSVSWLVETSKTHPTFPSHRASTG
jgi:hypothetical protein